MAPIENAKNIDKILEICKEIEDKRNDLAYSSPLEQDELLRDEINNFFEIKTIIEEGIGGIEI